MDATRTDMSKWVEISLQWIWKMQKLMLCRYVQVMYHIIFPSFMRFSMLSGQVNWVVEDSRFHRVLTYIIDDYFPVDFREGSRQAMCTITLSWGVCHLLQDLFANSNNAGHAISQLPTSQGSKVSTDRRQRFRHGDFGRSSGGIDLDKRINISQLLRFLSDLL